jgi:hypothetical protein
VRQGGEGEAGIGEADLLGIFREHLVGGFHDQPLALARSLLARVVDAVPGDQFVDGRHALHPAERFAAMQLGVCFRKLFVDI